MGGRLYKIGLFLILIIAIVVGAFYFFKGKTAKNLLPAQNARYGGGISINNSQNFQGDIYNTSNTTNNYNSTSNLTSQNINNQFSSQNNRNASLNYSANSVFNIDDSITRNFTKRSGDTLAFAANSREAMDEDSGLNIPGFSPKGYSKNASSNGQKACLFIFAEIVKDKNKILQMSAERQEMYILQKLRQIPNFGGISFEKQRKIIDGVLDDLKSSTRIDAEKYCQEILNELSSLSYQQCLMALNKIISQKITNYKEIEKILTTEITSFVHFYTAEQRKMIIEMIIEGMKNNTLSKEKICSFMESLMLSNLQDMLLYKQCIKVLNELNNKQTLSANDVIEALKKISGFTSLTQKQVQEIVNDILADKNTNGTIMNADIHCQKIVAYLLENIRGSEVYKQCLKVLEKIATKTPDNLLNALLEIPGFNLLSETEKNDILLAIQEAIDDGSIQDVTKRENLCTIIAGLILDAFSRNPLYEKCKKIITEIVEKNLNVKGKEKEILQMLSEINGFSLLSDEVKNSIVKDIININKEVPLEVQISNICINIVSAIDKFMSGTETYKQCIKAIDKIVASDPRLTVPQILDVLTQEIKGFSLISPIEQGEFANKIYTAISNNTIENDKHQICVLISTSIFGALDKNPIFQQCVASLTKAFNEGKSKDKEYIKSILKSLLSPANYIAYADEFADKISMFNTSDPQMEIYAFCINITEIEQVNLEKGECVKSIYQIASGKAEVRTFYDIRQFKAFSSDQKEDYILPKILTLKSNFDKLSTNQVLAESLKICSITIDGNNGGGDGGDGNNGEDINNLSGGGQTGPLDNTSNGSWFDGEMQNNGRENTGKCAILTNDIFTEYARASRLNLAPNQEIGAIEQFNDRLPDGEYYIPSQYLSSIEDTMSKDFDRILDKKDPFASKYTHDPERSNLLSIESVLYDYMYEINNQVNIEELELYKTIVKQLETSCQNRESFNTLLRELLKIPSFLAFSNDFAELPQYDIIKNRLTILLDNCSKSSVSSNNIASVALETTSKILKYEPSTAAHSIQNLLPRRVKANFLSRLFRDRDFIREIKSGSDIEIDYITQIGRCTRIDKDLDHWSMVSAKMQDLINGKYTPQMNVNANIINYKSELLNSSDYKALLNDVKNALSSPKNDIAIQTLISIAGFRNLPDSRATDFIERFNALYNECKDCNTKIEDYTYLLIAELIPVREKSAIKNIESLSSIAGCSGAASPLFSSKEKEFVELSPINQGLIARNARKLLLNFESSAKKQRYRIVERIWEKTKATSKPVSVPECEQIIDDVWSDYDSSYLDNALGDALQSFTDSLGDLLADLESGVGAQITESPSQKCKCYIEKIFTKLHNQVVDGYSACYNLGSSASSRNNSEKYMTFIAAMTDKYITSKEATMEAMEDTGSMRINSICSISFKAIRQIAGDTNEARKFMSSDLNNVTMKQICVQQLRDIYSTVSTLKESYFSVDEKDAYTNISNCDTLPD